MAQSLYGDITQHAETVGGTRGVCQAPVLDWGETLNKCLSILSMGNSNGDSIGISANGDGKGINEFIIMYASKSVIYYRL